MTGTQTNRVHRSVRYVFEIDTGELTPSEALAELRGRLACRVVHPAADRRPGSVPP
jgi:chloramphenicol 3-O-phosphotransferase